MTERSGAKSGSELGAESLMMFERWMRDARSDLSSYVYRGRLNREKIASACGFAKSVLQQNAHVKLALEAFETELVRECALPVPCSKEGTKGTEPERSDLESEDWGKRVLAAKARAEKRVKELEERTAILLIEVEQLRQQVKRFQAIGNHLERTGRLLP
jgi:hypothetical protein